MTFRASRFEDVETEDEAEDDVEDALSDMD
jgi:hypothetical protein